MSATTAAVLCFALVGFVAAEPPPAVGSFKCYQCSSSDDPNCGDPFVPSSTLQPTECQDLAYVAAIFFTNTFTEQRLKHACIKTIKTDAKGQVSITRKCSLDTSLIKDSNGRAAPTMCDEDAKQVPGEECRLCYEDGCNAAPAVLSSSWTALAAAALAAVAAHRLL